MTNDEINEYIHTEIMGKCVHENAKRNASDPLYIDCADCGRKLTQRAYHDENWNCRHSEKEPRFGAVRVCKHCGADDVSFGVGVRPRPDYCSDLNLIAEVEAKLIEALSLSVTNPRVVYCRHVMAQFGFDPKDLPFLYQQVISATALQRATACVEAHKTTTAR